MASLQLMDSYCCERGYPALGDIIPDLSAKIAGELDQKARREARIVQALSRFKQEEQGKGRSKGSATIQELVTVICRNHLDEQVRAMALEPLIGEVLLRLAKDGRVTFEVRRGVKR